MRVRAQQHDTLDALLWRHLGGTAGYVETALELNPQLAALGPVLPLGTPVELPDLQPATRSAPMVSLWD